MYQEQFAVKYPNFYLDTGYSGYRDESKNTKPKIKISNNDRQLIGIDFLFALINHCTDDKELKEIILRSNCIGDLQAKKQFYKDFKIARTYCNVYLSNVEKNCKLKIPIALPKLDKKVKKHLVVSKDIAISANNEYPVSNCNQERDMLNCLLEIFILFTVTDYSLLSDCLEIHYKKPNQNTGMIRVNNFDKWYTLLFRQTCYEYLSKVKKYELAGVNSGYFLD